MGVDNGPEIVREFFTGTGHSYDRISNLCTFGADRWWKRRIIDVIPQGSTLIMDQACGTGILSLKIARRFPHARVVGIDMTKEYLDLAKKKAHEAGVENVEFILGRAEETDPARGRFDCITSSYLAKYADLEVLVPGFRRLLKDRGTVVMHDFTYPSNAPFARLWELYFTILQRVASLKYAEWRAAFYGLPVLLRQTKWVGELQARLEENGFSDITTDYLTIGTAAIVAARKTEAPLVTGP
jgi:demethylmenaquinone methyltransferase / 2-methoxy-6-polyprenyl-1,4-benzoquinol methylase